MTTTAKKLDIHHKHVMRLIQRDRDKSGWTPVSETLYSTLWVKMPPELVEFKKLNVGGQARLTPKGEQVLEAMEYL